MPAYTPTLATAETALPPIDAAIDAPFDPSIGPKTRDDRPAERVLRLWKHHAQRGVIPELGTTKETKAAAHVNAGRWIVECPFPGCHSAQVPSYTDPRFFCIECENRPVGGRWVPVVWPTPATVKQIESALRARPAEHQFWRPGEKVKDLLLENAAHGVTDDADMAAQLEAVRIVLPWEADN